MLQRIIDGRTDLVFDLLEAGHPATLCDSGGTPLIAWCAYHGDVTALRYLLGRGASLSDLGPDGGLHAASFHGHWQLCQFLLESGADPNHALADTGETPLHAALCKANRPVFEHVVEVLLAHGADPNRPTRPSMTTSGFMRDCRTRGETALHRAAAFGTERTILRLLEAGARREARDMCGDSPLSWASWHLRPATVLRMLCHGGFSIHPDNTSTYDHGLGWGTMDVHALGRPHVTPPNAAPGPSRGAE